MDDIWQPIWLSIRLATVTTAFLLVLGAPLAWWLARSPRRWKEAVAAIGERAIEAVHRDDFVLLPAAHR